MNRGPKHHRGDGSVPRLEEGSFAALRITTKLRSRLRGGGVEKRVTELFGVAVRITERMRVRR